MEKKMLIRDIISEGPKDFDDMNLNSDKIQQSLDYFYKEHAPSKATGKKIDSFKGFDVMKFVWPAGYELYFLVKDDVPNLYLALSKYQDGLAVGNVRSNGTVKATEFYNYILDKITPKLYSDKGQTSAGRKIWTALDKFFPDITVTDVGDRLVATKSSGEKDAH
jgi:hypothetical protein